MNDQSAPETTAVQAFIARWQNAHGKERANYQLFLAELCQLLNLPGPEPATGELDQDAYVFERRVDIRHADGSETRGYIDLYKRGHFVLEAKRVSQEHASSGWDKAMLRAAAQADTYIRALPAADGRPPFLLTCDVGKTIEVYAEFTRSGGTYVPFPDPRTHRIHLEDLADSAIQARLIGIWSNPDALDPARHDWSQVEPAIFGTLLERALDPEERHKLGAHYTPRAYVERLVMPTVIEPLRDEWKDVQAAATLERQGKPDQAVKEIRAFHHKLCQIRILDPACGSAMIMTSTPSSNISGRHLRYRYLRTKLGNPRHA